MRYAFKAIDVVLIVLVAAVLLLLDANLKHRNEIAELKSAHLREQYAIEFTKVALGTPHFLNKISATDALIWSLLLRESRESPDANTLKEHFATDKLVSTPILTRYSDDTGSIGYVVVVGTRVMTPGNQKVELLMPTLAYYAGNRMGGLTRFDSLSANSGEFSVGGGWHSIPYADPFTKEIRTSAIRHLRAQSLHMCPDGKAATKGVPCGTGEH